jgi:hypothetical protein
VLTTEQRLAHMRPLDASREAWCPRSLFGLALLLYVGLWPQTAWAQASTHSDANTALVKVHATLGVIALGAFSTSLVVGAASGNLGKLMDPEACCPDGGTRDPVWRTTDRVLVNTGIVAYSGAAALAAYSLLFQDRPSTQTRRAHQAHRWLALAHGAAFLTSAVTGIIMQRSQSSNSETFARAAQIHTASNVVLMPVLTLALSNIVWE